MQKKLATKAEKYVVYSSYFQIIFRSMFFQIVTISTQIYIIYLQKYYNCIVFWTKLIQIFLCLTWFVLWQTHLTLRGLYFQNNFITANENHKNNTKHILCILNFFSVYKIILNYRLIDWLVLNAIFSSISDISWHWKL